jgi:hypothetical protein
MEWPVLTDIGTPPPTYEALDGYPGLFLCVRGDQEVGKLLDLRPRDTAPTFSNFARKPCEELVDLLRTALLKQREQLHAHWGKEVASSSSSSSSSSSKGTAATAKTKLPRMARSEDSTISHELKWLEKVNCAAEDRRAAKVMAKW